MKNLYEAIKNSKVAYISINNLPLGLQLPPFLDNLLNTPEDPEDDVIDPCDNDEALNWGEELSLGWNLPTMAPWKSLLLLDVDDEMDPHQILEGPHDNAEDKALAEGLVRFLETASVTLS
jgi:nitrogen permease regulator 3-like protein